MPWGYTYSEGGAKGRVRTHAVPAALHGHGLVRHHGLARRPRAEVRVGGRDGLVAFGVAERERVVVLRRRGKVERAGSRVVSVARL